MDNVDEILAHFNDLCRRIFDGEVAPTQLDAALYEFVVDKLWKAVQIGFGIKKTLDSKDIDYTTPDGAMLADLRKNVYYFSAAKQYQQLKAMNEALLDDEGKVRSFSQFKAAALDIHTEFNVNWLASEYNYAIASSQMAANWTRFQEDKKVYPNLTYQTVGDDRVRPEHQVLNGVTRPLDDSFWKKYYPPNGWGCRCDAIQVGGSARLTPEDKIVYPDIPKMFQTNTAIAGVVYPPEHPYWDIAAKDNTKVMAYGAAALAAVVGSTGESSLAETIAASLKEYKAIDTKVYEKHSFNKSNGGFIAIDKSHPKKELKHDLPIAEILQDTGGHRVYIEKVGKVKKEKYPDYKVDGSKADLKTIEKYTNLKRTIQEKIESANDQNVKICVIECEPKHFDNDLFYRRIKGALNPDRNHSITEVWVVHGNEIEYYKRAGMYP